MSSVNAVDGNFSPGCEIMSENKEEGENQRTQSTPRPWEIGRAGKETFDIFHLTHGRGKDGIIAKVHRKQDAILIAAAPELRERLADLVEYVAVITDDQSHQELNAQALLTRLRNEGA